MHDYRELLDAQSDTFEWPELDENTGAAMCYTSGTTGNPKGVVYSHRSNYLHTMQVCMSGAIAMSEGQRMLSIVPLFHANAWGIPYGALMSGATLVMPDRFLQAEPLAPMIQTLGSRTAPPCRRSGATCCATSTPTRTPTSRRCSRASSAGRPARRR